MVSQDGSSALTTLFIVAHFFGIFGLIGILLTALLSRNVRRHPTWISLCISWIISGLSSVLLFMANEQGATRPDRSLCLTQAALIYATPPLTSCTTLALVIQLWFNVRAVLNESTPKEHYVRTFALLLFPYVTWFTMFVGALCIGLQDRGAARKAPNGLYCELIYWTPGLITAIYVIVAMLCTIIIEVFIGFALYRNWHTFEHRRQALGMLVRVAMFSVVGIFAIALSVIYIGHWTLNPALSLVPALIPIVGVFIFASQSDILQVWMFWKPSPSTLESDLKLLKPFANHNESNAPSA